MIERIGSCFNPRVEGGLKIACKLSSGNCGNVRAVILLILLCLAQAQLFAVEKLPSVVDEDAAKFMKFLESPAEARVIEGIQGLAYLKHRPSEPALIRLLESKSDGIKREALHALCRFGGPASIQPLIRLLDDPIWDIRETARLGLERMTCRSFPTGGSKPWLEWWQAKTPEAHSIALLEELRKPAVAADAEKRRCIFDALMHLAQPPDEDGLLELLKKKWTPPLVLQERNAVAEALERVGTRKAVAVLAQQRTEAAAWALGRIGGADAEAALLAWQPTLPVLLNLDRIGSTNAAHLIPHLIQQMGLVTYRGQPDDLFLKEAQPIQRVGANLILRSGKGPLLLDAVLWELEATMKPPRASAKPPTVPQDWTPLLVAMREELKPGFVRNDGVTTSQPLTAMYMIARDKDIARRLIPLLRHPAFVPRIYVAMTLGKLRAGEALPEMLSIIREGYPFSDATALASGKHFDKSQTVRWRGFFCIALGRMGGEEARLALEGFASDASQPRDVRYGAVVGLGFIASPKSLPVLRRVFAEDIIWTIRDAAAQAIADIELLKQEGNAN